MVLAVAHPNPWSSASFYPSLEHLECSHQPHIQGAGELRSAPSGPDDRDRVAGKKALAPGVRVRRARAVK